MTRLLQRINPALPGLGIYFILWTITYSRVDYAQIASSSIDELWQSLGIEFLSRNPIENLGVLHIQPPGMNALYALDLAVTPSNHYFLLIIFFLAGAGSIWLTVLTLSLLGLPKFWSASSGFTLAVLSGTVTYTFWPYTVTLVAFLTALTAWGLALMKTRPALGALISASSVLGLQLLRSSFVWVLVIGWCGLLAVRLIQSVPRNKLLASLIPVLVVAGISVGSQLYYFTQFKLPTMSSWSGMNLAKALAYSDNLNVTPQAREEINEDGCLSELLIAYESEVISIWDFRSVLALPGCASLTIPIADGVAAWDDEIRPNGSLNYNSRSAFAASREWTKLITIVLKNDPTQLLKMGITSGVGPRSSGIGLYLDPTDEFPAVNSIRQATPTNYFTGILALVIGPSMLVLIFLGIMHAIVNPHSFLRRNWVFWGILGLVIFHAGVSNLGEWGENMRFRAEIDPILLLLGVMSLYAFAVAVPRPGSSVTKKMPSN